MQRLKGLKITLDTFQRGPRVMEELGHISERSKGSSYNIDYSAVLVPKDKKLLQQIHSHSSFLSKL